MEIKSVTTQYQLSLKAEIRLKKTMVKFLYSVNMKGTCAYMNIHTHKYTMLYL